MSIFKNILDFILVNDKTVWQDVVLSAIIIPIVIFLCVGAWRWWINIRPLNLLLKGFRRSEFPVLVFVAQLSQADNLWKKIDEPKYLQLFPSPTPTDQFKRGEIHNKNIDPVWSETNGLCVSEVFNVLGRTDINDNIKVADLISDWNAAGTPIISVGFNAKTFDLEKKCKPIYYHRKNDFTVLSIEGFNLDLSCVGPNDAGIIQKTFIEHTGASVLILAGLGTTATVAAGKLFRQNAVTLGMFYGNKAFCILFEANSQKGRDYYEIKAIYPRPNLIRKILHPFKYWKWHRKNIFAKNN